MAKWDRKHLLAKVLATSRTKQGVGDWLELLDL